MKKILIADSSKASLVMTSEVFKDHYPGIQVLVAKTSEEAIELAKNSEGVDAFVIDFDLPDANGAQTAFLLKKLYETPILITAFDRPDVVQSIETSLHQYADCQSWLKKPVNPEVVIAVAQRFCDGKTRVQKRVLCNLPVFAEVWLENESVEAFQQIVAPQKIKKTVAKEVSRKEKEIKPSKITKIEKTNKTTKSKKEAAIPIPIYFCGIIEDCSLSGVRLKPSKNGRAGLTDWNLLLASMEIISSGSSVTLKLPSHSDIESGSMLEIAKISHLPNIIENQIVSEKGKRVQIKEESPIVKGKKIQKKVPSLSTLSSSTKKKAVEKDFTHRIQSMVGKVSWTSSESGEWCIGVEFDNQTSSKRLFEAILSYQLKQQKNFPTQSVMKTSRAS